MEHYVHIKLHAKIFKGVLKIMRLSGEGPTFDFNTYCNIAFNHLKHKIPKGTVQMYAGDDMVQNLCPRVQKGWASLSKLFTLVSKPEESMTPTFVSWRLTRHGLIREPEKLYNSLKLAEEQGNMA